MPLSVINAVAIFSSGAAHSTTKLTVNHLIQQLTVNHLTFKCRFFFFFPLCSHITLSIVCKTFLHF